MAKITAGQIRRTLRKMPTVDTLNRAQVAGIDMALNYISVPQFRLLVTHVNALRMRTKGPILDAAKWLWEIRMEILAFIMELLKVI